MEKTIKLIDMTTKKAKTDGKEYKVFKTNEGDMSCFEADVVISLMTHLQKCVLVEVAERVTDKGTWKNITKFISEGKESDLTKEQTQGGAPPCSVQPAKVELTSPAVVLDPKFRVNIKQNAKKEAYFEVTIRADTEVEAKQRLDEAILIALTKCDELNMGIVEQEVVSE